MITFSPSKISKKLSTFIDLDDEEIPVVEAFTKSRAQSFSGRDLVHEGQNHPPIYVLRAGWAFSYKIQQNGERQIVGFHIPGDFLGMRSLLTHRSDQIGRAHV